MDARRSIRIGTTAVRQSWHDSAPGLTLKAAMPSRASRATSCARRATALGPARLKLPASRRLWQCWLAWPAMADARPTPSTPRTGPATGVAQDTRRVNAAPCGRAGLGVWRPQLCLAVTARHTCTRRSPAAYAAAEAPVVAKNGKAGRAKSAAALPSAWPSTGIAGRCAAVPS